MFKRKAFKPETLPNGMKVLDRQTFAPISLLPRDSLSCVWDDGQGNRTQLATYECTEAESIDTAIIVRLDDGSLKALGLKGGLAGVFGEALK